MCYEDMKTIKATQQAMSPTRQARPRPGLHARGVPPIPKMGPPPPPFHPHEHALGRWMRKRCSSWASPSSASMLTDSMKTARAGS